MFMLNVERMLCFYTITCLVKGKF